MYNSDESSPTLFLRKSREDSKPTILKTRKNLLTQFEMDEKKIPEARRLQMPPLMPYANSPFYCATSPMMSTPMQRSPVIVKNYSLDAIARELAAAKIQAQSQEKPGVLDISSLRLHRFTDAGVDPDYAREGLKLRYNIKYLADGASGLRERVEKKAQSNPFLLDGYDLLEKKVADYFNRITRDTVLNGDSQQLKLLRELTVVNTRIPVDVETTTRPPVTSRVNSKPLFKPELHFCYLFWSFLEGKQATGYILNLRQPSPCVLYGKENEPTIINNRTQGVVQRSKSGHLILVFDPLPPVRKRVESEERLSKFRAPTSFYYFVVKIENYWFLCPPFRILVHMNKQNVIQRQKLEIEAADGQQKVVEMSGRCFAISAFLMTEQLPPETATPLFHGQFSENLRKWIKGSGDLRQAGLDVLEALDFQLHIETGRGFCPTAIGCWREHIIPSRPPGVASLWEQFTLTCVAGTLHTPEEMFWNTVNALKQNEHIHKAWTEGYIPGPLCSFCVSEMLRQLPEEAQLVSFHLESGHSEMVIYYKQKDSVSVQQKGPFCPMELVQVMTEIRELVAISRIVDWRGEVVDKERILRVLMAEETAEKSGHSREGLKRQFSESLSPGRLRSIHDTLPDKVQELTVQDMTRTFLAREHMNDNLSLRLLQVLKKLEECMKFQRILHIASYHGRPDYWERLHNEWLQQLAQVDNEFEWLANALQEAIKETESTSQFRIDLTRHLERLRKCSLIFLSQPPPRIIRRANVKVVANNIAATSPIPGSTPATIRFLGKTALWGDILMAGIEWVEAAVLTEEKVHEIMEKTAPYPEKTIHGSISIDENMMSASFMLTDIERLSSELPMKSVFGGPQRHYYMLAKAQNCTALSLPFLFLLPYLKKQRDGDRFLFGTLMFSETLPPPRLPQSDTQSPSSAMQQRIEACSSLMPVSRMVDVLDILFRCYTGVSKRLSETCRSHLAARLRALVPEGNTEISWQNFSSDHLPNKYRDSAFSFEEWFFDCTHTVRVNEGVQKFWNQGLILGFMPKEDILPILMKAGTDSMYLKFSDSVSGGVLLIALNNGAGADYFHMAEAQYLLSSLPKIAREPIKGTKKREPIKKILAWSDNQRIEAKPFDPDNFGKEPDAKPDTKTKKIDHPYARTLEPDISRSTMEQVRSFDRQFGGGLAGRVSGPRRSESSDSETVDLQPTSKTGDQSLSLAEEETKPRNDLNGCEELVEFSQKMWGNYRNYLEDYLNRQTQKPEMREELQTKLESVKQILTNHQQQVERLLNESMQKITLTDSAISSMDSEPGEGCIAQARLLRNDSDWSSSSIEVDPLQAMANMNVKQKEESEEETVNV